MLAAIKRVRAADGATYLGQKMSKGAAQAPKSKKAKTCAAASDNNNNGKSNNNNVLGNGNYSSNNAAAAVQLADAAVSGGYACSGSSRD